MASIRQLLASHWGSASGADVAKAASHSVDSSAPHNPETDALAKYGMSQGSTTITRPGE